MHGILHATLLLAISFYVQVDTSGSGYIFHPQPWVLTRRTLPDSSGESTKVMQKVAAEANSRSTEDDDSYLMYSVSSQEQPNANIDDASNTDKQNGRYQENRSVESGDDYEASSGESKSHQEQEQRYRSRYRDEPLMEVEDDEDFAYEFSSKENQQSYSDHQGYSAHAPYHYDDDGYDQEMYNGAGSEINSGGYEQSLQMETNSEPYDDEVGNNDNNNQDETYSLETDTNADQQSSSKSKNAKSDTASSEAASKENDSQARGDEGPDSEEDDYYDDDDEEDDDDNFYDDGGDKGKGKGKKGKKGGGDEVKKPNAPFWAPQDYLLGNPSGGAGWAVQGPPVYYEDGEPQWPPEEQGNGKGRKGGKGDKGGKMKGKKGKKGKKGGRGQNKGWRPHGWGGWEQIGQGGWGQWPKGWISSTNLDTGDQRWVEGKGWVGETGVRGNWGNEGGVICHLKILSSI